MLTKLFIEFFSLNTPNTLVREHAVKIDQTSFECAILNSVKLEPQCINKRGQCSLKGSIWMSPIVCF